MRLFVVVIPAAYLLTQAAAFLVPHSPVRSITALQDMQSASDAFKGGIKYLLVPNAKKPYTPPPPAAAVEPIVSEDAYSNLPIPDISGAPAVVVDTPPPPPVANIPKPSLPEISTKDVVAPMQDLLNSIKLHERTEAPPGVVPNLSEYIKSKQIGGFQVNTEKLKSLGVFKPDLDNVQNNIQTLGIPVQKFVATWATLRELLRSGYFTMAQLVEALNFQELGGWYLGAFSILVAGIAAASQPPEPITANQAVREAMDVLEKPMEETERVLTMEEQVAQLTKATAAVSKELTQLKTEKASRDYEVATLKSDMRELKNQLDSSRITERELQSSLKETEKKFTAETEKLRKELEKRTASEERLKKELADTEEKLKIEKEKAAAAQKKAKEEAANASAAVKTLKAEKDSMKAELDKLAAEAAGFAAQLGVEAPKRQAPKATPQLEETIFASVEESVDELPVAAPVVPGPAAKEATRASKKAPKKAAKQAAEVTMKASKDAGDDWSKLSPSTLKRKTVKDLTAYLEERGQKTTDANGKTLRKADLVDIVLSVTV